MPRGRPTKLTQEIRDSAEELALLGLTLDQMAGVWDVGTTTVDRWIADDEEFRCSIKKGGRSADGQVARSLWEKAKGGDTVAMIFWLKNRNPAAWNGADKTEVTHKTDLIALLSKHQQ